MKLSESFPSATAVTWYDDIRNLTKTNPLPYLTLRNLTQPHRMSPYPDIICRLTLTHLTFKEFFF